MQKIKIVGCGLSGAVAARILKDKGYDVVVFETRNHIGGNCYDSVLCGTLVHNYGPHVFHTDDEEVFSFLSLFTEWIDFKLRPTGNTLIGKIPLPYHDLGCQQAIGKTLSQEEIIEYIFKDYSEKQWGVPFDEIPQTITNRIPKTKECENPTWFEGQKYQCIPKNGYTKMFEKMLNDIEVLLNCQEDDWKNVKSDLTIYTGPIDKYFEYCYGKLPYRSLRFEHEVTPHKMDNFIQNENNKNATHTRTYDHSFVSPNHKGLTIITKEFPKKLEDGDIPYYPIPWGESQEIYNQYKKLAKNEKNVIFLGRLATYKYLDMWMAVKHVILKLKNL